VVLLSEITQAWICTIHDQAGIYERILQGSAAGQFHGKSGADELSSSTKVVNGILTQHAWVLFLLEAWQVSFQKAVTMSCSSSFPPSQHPP
jgi:hypothetical protein